MRGTAEAFLDETELLFDLLVRLKSYPKTSEYEDERSDAMSRLMTYLQNVTPIFFFCYCSIAISVKFTVCRRFFCLKL